MKRKPDGALPRAVQTQMMRMRCGGQHGGIPTRLSARRSNGARGVIHGMGWSVGLFCVTHCGTLIDRDAHPKGGDVCSVL